MKSFQLVRDLVIKHHVHGIKDIQQSLRLLNHMKKFGKVTAFKFMRDPVTSERTGMAFITYKQYSDAQDALKSRRQTVPELTAPFNEIEVTPYQRQARKE
ncbi:hypothetical protein COEREDRAFT_11789 [Coemansia reversa NRRL 1564]|uniref:RRM domain-containing protein n=1 Tax=Coemansia reversa (strain ATCC 12441 / NRRL 1564) TaxID=763665 RepID=A0A2G5B296_COERN|nr:hypothetical protein COEREDRAFT_11789 [Coemansia reversa NRRL 1564]|eukprot:PIA13138.1 hypothetical protein COEREDRAFT_11789 [Coemansia reversa NRRL 1564]